MKSKKKSKQAEASLSEARHLFCEHNLGCPIVVASNKKCCRERMSSEALTQGSVEIELDPTLFVCLAESGLS